MIQVGVADLPETFEALARDAMKEHEKRFLERGKAVREACNALDNAASKFVVAVRNSWGTMDKSASEYGTRMAQSIEETARKLSGQQTSSGYDATEQLHTEAIEVLNKIIKTVRRYVPKLRRGLRVEIASLNSALGRLEMSVRSLGQALDQSPGRRIETTRRDIQQLKHEFEELLELKKDLVKANALLEENAVKASEALTAAQEYTSNSVFQELRRYEDSLRSKEDEIKQFIQPVTKPLAKLERKESDRKNKTLDVTTLHGLIDSPVQTVTTSQPFVIIQLLEKLAESLSQGNIEIEERKRHKAEQTILQSKEGSIQRLREDYLTIQANVQETVRQLRTTGLLEKKTEVEQRQAAISGEKERLIAHIAELNRRIDAITKTIMGNMKSLQQQIKQITGKEIEISIEG